MFYNLFIIASSKIPYTNKNTNQPAILYKLLCKDKEGKSHEVVTSSEPTAPVAICTFHKKGETIYTKADGTPVTAAADQFSVQYYTSADQVSAAKNSLQRIEELEW